MFDCYYYWFCVPVRETIVDSPDRIPAFTVELKVEHEAKYTVALFLDSDEEPIFLRVKIPNLPDKDLPESMYETLNTIRQHMYSVLRQCFDSNFAFQEYFLWQRLVVPVGTPIQHTFVLEETRRKGFPHHVANFFVETYTDRELLRLYVDGFDAKIPAQYRFLSFYKILELNYKRGKRKWDNDKLDPILELHSSKFKEMGFNNGVLATLIDTRDKCAHIKTGQGDRQVLGVTYLNTKEYFIVRKLLPQIQHICARVLNERLAGKWQLFISDGD